jgi:hypothetical protein
MIKLDPIQRSLTHIADSNVSPESSNRLIVLVPPDIDYSAATRRIWKHSNAIGMPVLLLGLCKDAVEEPGLRRGLVIMASLLQDGEVSAEIKIEFGANWVEAVRRTHHAGDMILCFAEQRAGLLHRPLGQILQSNLNVAVYILSPLTPRKLPQADWLSQVIAWLGSAGIIAGSFLLQARITSLPQDWAQTTLLLFSVFGEIWFLCAWNNWFR